MFKEKPWIIGGLQKAIEKKNKSYKDYMNSDPTVIS